MDLGTLILGLLAIGTFSFALWIALMVREMVKLSRRIWDDQPETPWDWLDR